MSDTEDIPTTIVGADEKQKKNDANVSDLEDEDDDFRAKIFPQRLMELLSDERNADCIAWLPHGRAFIIRNRKLFAEKVMPKFFPRKSKYSSFTRKLNRWNFVRISSGPELGAYYHEFFLRDKPHLAAQMFCKNARTKLAMATHGENPASFAAAAGAGGGRPPQQEIPSAAAAVGIAPVHAASLAGVAPTPNFGVSSHYAAAAAALKQNLLPPGADPGMLLQLREQQKLLETQMNIVRQADPATQLILQQAILKEQSTHMQQLGMALPQHQHNPAASQSLLATTLALQQSQARLMQMREVLKMKFRQQHQNQNRSPHNNRASAA